MPRSHLPGLVERTRPSFKERNGVLGQGEGLDPEQQQAAKPQDKYRLRMDPGEGEGLLISQALTDPCVDPSSASLWLLAR